MIETTANTLMTDGDAIDVTSLKRARPTRCKAGTTRLAQRYILYGCGESKPKRHVERGAKPKKEEMDRVLEAWPG